VTHVLTYHLTTYPFCPLLFTDSWRMRPRSWLNSRRIYST